MKTFQFIESGDSSRKTQPPAMATDAPASLLDAEVECGTKSIRAPTAQTRKSRCAAINAPQNSTTVR